MDVAGRGNVKYSATYLYINDVFIFRSAKVAVISDREYLVRYFVFWFFASMT